MSDGTTKLIDNKKAPYSNGLLLENILIPSNYVYYYTIDYAFNETGVNQDVDKSKSFSAGITLELIN